MRVCNHNIKPMSEVEYRERQHVLEQDSQPAPLQWQPGLELMPRVNTLSVKWQVLYAEIGACTSLRILMPQTLGLGRRTTGNEEIAV